MLSVPLERLGDYITGATRFELVSKIDNLVYTFLVHFDDRENLILTVNVYVDDIGFVVSVPSSTTRYNQANEEQELEVVT